MAPKKDEATHIRLNQAMWDRWSISYDGGNPVYKLLRNQQREIIASLDIREDVRFLDIGCATGFAVGEAAKRANGKGRFFGIDLSDGMIEKAKINFSGRDNFQFMRADAASIPLAGDFFDIIICTNSFHHYLHPDKAVGEMSRLLRKDGKAYILDITADNMIVKLFDAVARSIEPQHVRFYSSEEFRRMFESAGLKCLPPRKFKLAGKIHIAEK